MNQGYRRLISLGALTGLAGFLLSGPIGLFIVQTTHPQPNWVSPAVFATNYRAVQDMPYYFGLLLIGGMLMLAAGHYLISEGESELTRFHLLLAAMWTTFFAALIFFNYSCQTTFVRHLALHYRPANDPLIATFSMANPSSLAWSIEIWGYGVLGVANWLMSGYYAKRNRPIYWLLILNGLVSVLTVVFTVVDMEWLMSTPGLAGFIAWNVLMISLMVLIYRHFSPNHQTMVKVDKG